LCGHGVSPKNSIKGREKTRLLRRFFTLLLTKNYSFWIKMSTRIKRLSFAILYSKAKPKNEEFKEGILGKEGVGNTYKWPSLVNAKG
jgi:hypothetical protein